MSKCPYTCCINFNQRGRGLMMNAKEEREAFVSGLSGTSIWEIYGVILTSILGFIVRHVGILCSQRIAQLHNTSFLFAILWEYITIFLPALLCVTILADHYYIVTVALVSIITIAIATKFNKTRHIPTVRVFSELPYPNRSPAVSTSRSYVNVFTAIAILAVDFHIFPRRFAKAETYGVGVMDIGVGSYMICHGMVSREARGNQTSIYNRFGYLQSILLCLKKALPYIVIGLLRLTTVNATDYQQHVSEYGVHWNFFFTIATVKTITTVIAPLPLLLPKTLRYVIFGSLIALLYQLLLSRFGLMDYVIYGPGGNFSRESFISANREGIASCLGYLTVYYLGVGVGGAIHSVKRKTIGHVSRVFVILLAAFLCCIVVAIVTDKYFDRISRRVANISYCYWIISVQGLAIVTFFLYDLIVIYLMESLRPPSPPSHYYLDSFKGQPRAIKYGDIIAAIDYNQFGTFLLANLGTGVVNFTVDTIHTGPVLSFVILTVYLVVITTIVMAFRYHKIKIF